MITMQFWLTNRSDVIKQSHFVQFLSIVLVITGMLRVLDLKQLLRHLLGLKVIPFNHRIFLRMFGLVNYKMNIPI